MTNLSPATQAVLDAGRQYATQAWSDATHQRFNLGLAAALRAAADQVVPHPGRYPMNEYMEGLRDCKQDFYAALLGIAAELEQIKLMIEEKDPVKQILNDPDDELIEKALKWSDKVLDGVALDEALTND